MKKKYTNSDSLTSFYKATELVKRDFTSENLSNLIETYGDVFVEDLARDREKAKIAISDLPLEFYTYLAKSFVENLNNIPEFWMIHNWRLYDMFTLELKNYINNEVLKFGNDTSAGYIYQGLLAMDESPDLAIIYFNKVEHYLAAYYKGFCYHDLKNYPNAIKNFNEFQRGLKAFFTSSFLPGVATNHSLEMFRWDIHLQLGWLYNQTKHYGLAKKEFEKAISVIKLEDAYYVLGASKKVSNGRTDFEIFVNNFLFSLEKIAAYKEAVELLENVLDFLPKNNHYKKQLQNFKDLIARHKSADDILKNIIPVKRPFNIESYSKTQLLAREKILEDMILEQIKYGYEVFGKKLELYQDDTIHGRQYFLKEAYGFLDLLLIEKTTDTLYVVELKRNLAGVEVVHQIERYIEALEKEIKKDIKGIICLHQSNPVLTQLVKSKANLELFTYGFDFKKLG